MSFGIQQRGADKSWTSLLLEESEFSLKAKKMKRGHTFRRMYMTVFVLFGAIFLVICSIFYVGAFVDVGKVVGVSYADRAVRTKVDVASNSGGPLASIKDLFNIDRVYMRAGQSIVATYEIPRGAQLNLVISQCKNRPIIEVFDCQLIGEQTKRIGNTNKGFYRFAVAKPGFYHFGQSVKTRNGTELEADSEFKIVWQRG